MRADVLEALLQAVRAGDLSVEAALRRLTPVRTEPLRDLVLDHEREARTGIPETIFGEGKTADQIERAVAGIAATGQPVLATRLAPEVGQRLLEVWPAGEWHRAARIFHLPRVPAPVPIGLVAVVCAGTSDIPVADEAAVTARALGARVETAWDVGVAGLHRLLAHLDLLSRSRVVVVAAGMEGALASVVAGLVPAMVIAVPTSVGYGASFGGLAALLAMLNSCGSGVLVSNIDNGYGAGVAAARINKMGEGRS